LWVVVTVVVTAAASGDMLDRSNGLGDRSTIDGWAFGCLGVSRKKKQNQLEDEPAQLTL
jgi:hypothetical protein